MLKKTIEYVDFNDQERSEVFYFNLTEPEIVRIDASIPGGLEDFISNLDEETNPQEIIDLFEMIIKAAYGEKSEDGRLFIKSEEKSALFSQSAAYSSLFMELVTDADKAADFFSALISKTIVGPYKTAE